MARMRPRWLLERWGPALGPLVGQLRERRLRQRLSDGFVEVPDGPIPLVEYALSDGSEAGVAHLAVHPWGAVVAPLDERRPWIRVRRSGIGAVDEDVATAGLLVHADDGRPVVDLPRLGPGVAGTRAAFERLRDGAATDAGAILAALAPDVPFAARDRAARLLVDGTPADRAALGAAWGPIEAAVLTEPTFAASYAAVVERAGGETAVRWFAMAPEDPGSPTPKMWFLVTLPGNLVALELVSGGAHATYCFRARPRAEHPGGLDGPGRGLRPRPCRLGGAHRRPLPPRADRPPGCASRTTGGTPIPPGSRGPPDARGGAGGVRGAPRAPGRGDVGCGSRRPHRVA